MSSKAKENFDNNKKDIDQIWKIHQKLSGDLPGRRFDVDILNRAAIVFITACWESFVEDLAKEAFDFLLANASNSNVIPSKVQNYATEPILNQKDPKKVWEFTDDGWRKILISHRDNVIKQWVDTLNTPRTKQVNELFEKLIGYPKVSDKWFWKNMSKDQASKKLEEYMTIRGDIAHRVKADKTVYKTLGNSYLNHVEKLAGKTDKTVSDHLKKLTGKNPW